MNYISVTVHGIDEHTYYSLLSNVFDAEYAGVEEQGNQYIFFFEEDKWTDEYLNKMKALSLNFTIETIGKKNWNEVWESNFSPVEIEDFCYIRAHFHPEKSGFKHQILITPKMSFGTGHHATTHQMMLGMKDIEFSGKKVLDYGTGTGILAILAEQLGAASIDAIDNDEWSVDNTNENLINNHTKHVTVYLSELVAPFVDRRYDIILANINRNIILQSLHQLTKMLSNGGQLLISGILETDVPDIRAEIESFNLSVHHITNKDKWSYMIASKNE